MVPGLIRVPKLSKTRVAAAFLWGVLLLGVSSTGRAVPNLDPGSFVPLKLGHEGESYADALPAGPTYRLVSGRLPSGLDVTSAGRFRGTPRQRGTFAAVFEATQGSRSYPVRVAMTVYAADESDLKQRTPSFKRTGPYATEVETIALSLTSTFDQERMNTLVRVVRPRGASGPRPLLLFHRGRGFDEDSYTRLHERIASWGIAVASVEDRYSFAGDSFSGENRVYDHYRAELGMQSASGVVEAVADYLLDRSGDPADSLAGSFDRENLFFAGHSRGGGAVHESHHRSLQTRLKGVIYLMAFDLRYFSAVAAPADAPANEIADANPRLPSLVIAAENDGDLTYPIADQLIDRATGPTTQVTIYGAVHNLISDSARSDGNDKITRREEREQVADWIVCFVKRWAEQDTDLDWRLYGGGHQGASEAGVTSWRPSNRTLLFEDAQDSDLDRNLLGRNLVANMRRRERSHYPDVGDMDRLGLQHTILTPTDQVAIWRMASDSPLDLSAHQRVVLRMAQTSARGWSKQAVWLRLLDASGGASYYRVWDPAVGGHLPEFTGLSPLDRFVDVHVQLDDFFAGSSASSGAKREEILALDLFLVEKGSGAGSAVVDAVRFE